MVATRTREHARAGDRLTSLLAKLGDDRHYHHVVLGAASLDGRFRWAGAAGNARSGGEPMTTATPYFVASVTKLYTAATTLRLVEQDRLALADPMSAHLPAETIRSLHVLDGVDHTAEVTVQHLLGHSSGLPDYLEDKPRGGHALVERLMEGRDVGWDPTEALRIAREDLTPHFPPQPLDGRRTRRHYADTNYHLLGLIIESVTGQPLHEVVGELLLAPLGLHHTGFYGFDEGLGEPAALYVGDREVHLPQAMRSFWADGGIVSTIDDQLDFGLALFGGAVLEDAASLELMRSGWKRIFFPLSYGHGMMRFALPPPLGWLAGPPVIGHSGSSGSWLFHCPARDVVLAGTVDQAANPSHPFRVMPKVLRALG